MLNRKIMEKESSETDVKESAAIETKSLPTKSRNTRSSTICHYYLNNEICKFGSNCRFLHSKRKFDKNMGIKNFQSKSASKKDTHDKSYRNPMSKNFTVYPTDRFSNNFSDDHLNIKVIRPCRYFKAGNCKNAERCNFSHSSEDSSFPQFHSFLSSLPMEKVKNISTPSNHKRKYVPSCRYFRKGFCQNGDNCKFYHHKSSKENQSLSNTNCAFDQKDADDKENFHQKQDFTPSDTDNLPAQSIELKESDLKGDEKLCHEVNLTHNSRNIFELSSEDEISQLRNTEITQFKKRFPNHEVLEENTAFCFVFEPSDPDWPYDLKSMKLEVTFPQKYPTEVCKILVYQNISFMPELLIRHLNKDICDWLTERHKASLMCKKVELLFRPFLKWFDRNVEILFDSGLKRVKQDIDARNSGIEFVPVEKLFPSSGNNKASDNASTSKEGELSEENLVTEFPLKEEESSTPSLEQKSNQIMSQNIGTKVLFIGLELVEGAAAISCTKLSGVLHCARCKTPCNVKSVPNKNNCVACSKCSRSMEYNFAASIMHQFSNTLGTINLVECQIGDVNLVECTFLVDCLNCSKQVAVDGIHYGQKQKLWCKFCNQKLIIGIEGVKFQASSPTYSVAKPTVTKKVEKKKDVFIKEGGPLPEFGTCKHYKKSNRWLRFPCCGRIYPCDICHEEKESDHEMKFATRMICGFCSKEQPYTKDKPCSGCSGNVVAKSGAHWEGGKGCRNKVKMSRNDIHKYVGTCKTVSKKSQSTGNKKKK